MLRMHDAAKLDVRARRQAHEPNQSPLIVVEKLVDFMTGHTARRLQDPSEVQPFVLPAHCRELLHLVAVLVGQRLLPD